MRYPIFLFDGDDFSMYEATDDHWDDLEAYDVDYPDILLDSDGRLLTKSDAGNDGVRISDSGSEPDPERLRSMLIHVLRRWGQEWADDATLDTLIPAARTAYRSYVPLSIGEMISGLLRRLHVKKP